MIKIYTRKPIEILAVQWVGDNLEEVTKFLGKDLYSISIPFKTITIETLEGNHTASNGDYIIRGIKGEHYPCKPDIFKMIYIENCFECESEE